MLAVLVDYNCVAWTPTQVAPLISAKLKNKEGLREPRAPLVLELVCAPKRASHLQFSRVGRLKQSLRLLRLDRWFAKKRRSGCQPSRN